MKSWVTALNQALLWQHQNPFAFREAVENRGAWKIFWPVRFSAALLLIASYFAIYPFRLELWGTQYVIWTSRTLFIFALCASLAIMVTVGSARFWLLYTFSPPILLLAMLCGLTPLIPIGQVMILMIALPFTMGVFWVDVSTIWVSRAITTAQSDHARTRGGGPAAELHIFQQWRRIETIRLIAAGVLLGSIVAGAILITDALDRLFVCLALFFSAAGVLRLEATLLAWWGRWPLVTYATTHHRWQATYTGRTAVIVPIGSIVKAITLPPPAREAGYKALALLQEGSLGWLSGMALARLSTSEIHSLILHLSLLEGGSQAVYYVEPALPPASRPAARRFAVLAAEAAKPFDLQHWLAILPSVQPRLAPASLEAQIEQVLNVTREALLCYEPAPILEQACLQMQTLVQMLYIDTQFPPLSWPVALQQHLEQHRQQLAG